MRGFLSREISSKGNIWASASSSCRTAGEGEEGVFMEYKFGFVYYAIIYGVASDGEKYIKMAGAAKTLVQVLRRASVFLIERMDHPLKKKQRATCEKRPA